MLLPPFYDEILLAQEEAEDQRLKARAQEVWQTTQEYSCPEGNETTPWLRHTQWPSIFRSEPLDASASAQKPRSSPNNYLLGVELHFGAQPSAKPSSGS